MDPESIRTGSRPAIAGRLHAGTRAARPGPLGLLLLALLPTILFLLAAPSPAEALPQWIHSAADQCTDCHHPEPPSFNECADCHPDPQLPNQKCTQCHAGKTTKGETCWDCHEPGAPQPEPVDANCQACHGPMPHLGAQLGDSPGCTVCHSTDPTPHHDAVDQVAPSTCNDCHTDVTEGHAGNGCTACHRTDVHPHFPEVPATCNNCHDAAVFNGKGSCLQCHFGQPYFGQSDMDVHDNSLPDAPISESSCRSCHPQAQKHAGQVACLSCHTQATPFHHGTAASPGFPACQTCHGEKFQHGGPLPCTDCHSGAHHQVDPPTPGPQNCNRCHLPEDFGTKNCFGCHQPPIFHVEPSVPDCTGCHQGYRIHNSLPNCRTCHTNATRGHHIGSVRIPSCQTEGCHGQQKHVGRVACQSCHRNAAHDPTPRNLPANPWLVCDRCHSFADKVGQPCSDCHDETQHSATYRVPGCSSCHDNERHQKKVDCRRCHVNIANGHHNAGEVSQRGCSVCHVDARPHAKDTEAGRDFVCNTCHDGEVHGTLEKPEPDKCLECHEKAELHSGDNNCIRCHWPAAHDATPDASQQGDYSPMRLNLPPPSNGTGRDEFAGTGYDALIGGGMGIFLLALGIVLRLGLERRLGLDRLGLGRRRS